VTRHLSCAAGDVHVWQVTLDREPSDLAALEAVLSEEERKRAFALKTEELRRRWTVARAALRAILAAYIGASPKSLVFSSGANGKPKLANVDPAPSFSLSHTAHLAFLAVANRECVGIDAEILRPEIELGEISRRFFLRAEADEIGSLPPEMRTAAFYACWTRKEAYVKARGIGLLAALNKFQVTVRPDEPAQLQWVEECSDEPWQWNFHDLSEPGVAVALAVKSPKTTFVRRFVFSDPVLEMTGKFGRAAPVSHGSA
jgi:4'-phosphopantetheinyl transferase